MLLRKYLRGRRIRSTVADFTGRCLYLLFSGLAPDGTRTDRVRTNGAQTGGTEEARPCWLCLDLRLGPRLDFFDYPPLPEEVRCPAVA